jgi:4-amino-4-deoxy-L-arabinose transferase-like glycosyltransferase
LRTPAEFGRQEALRRQQFQPHGFAPYEGNPRVSPTYAVGLPLHLALAGKLVGWAAGPVIVGLAAALGAILLCYAVARQLGVGPGLASAGAAVLAAYPVFIFTSIQPLSDTLATTWCLMAVFTALHARERPAWALACGAALAMAVLVRTTNVLLLPALLVLLEGNPRRLGLALVGGLPGAVWLGYYNHALYGSALRSGYVNIAEAFAWEYGLPTMMHFITWLALLLPAVLLVLPFAAVAGPGRRGRDLLALALWFGAFAGLYSFYETSREVWWDLRFILPGTPALILGALLGIEAFARSRAPRLGRRVRGLGAVALTVWSIGLGAFWTQRLHLLLTKTYEQAFADASLAARDTFPANALVLAGLHSGALYYYTGFPVLRWEFVDPAQFSHFRTLTEKAGRPICAVLHNVEEREALQEHCPGNWRQVARRRDVTLWQLTAPTTAPLAK